MIRTSLALQGMIAIMLLAMVTGAVIAADGDWTELGEAEISDKDSDNRVQIKSEDSAVTHIKLRVGQKAARINSIVVAFDSGDNQTINVGTTLQPGEMTKAYNLEGKKRRIERIVINAAVAKKEDGKAKLIVYGQKS